MIIKQILTGGDRNYGYVVGDKKGGAGILIDPSYSPEKLLEEAKKDNLEIKYVFCTHGHSDHTNGNRKIKELTGIEPLLFGDIETETEIKVQDGTTFPMGELAVKILHTPGHTDDGICIYIGDAVFTGDTLFVGKVGGTYGDNPARAEYSSLHKKLMTLPDETRVYPGHNYGVAPTSTIGHEKKTNPFILQQDFEAFLDLKNNWVQYKKEHGIN